MQLGGYRLAHCAKAIEDQADSPIPQFSIRQLMAATAVVGLAFAGLARVSKAPPGHSANETVQFVVGCYFAAITLASLAASLLFEHSAVPVAAIVVTSTALGLAVALMLRRDDLIGPAMLLMGGTAMIETAAFGLLRHRGYRLRRVRRSIAAQQ